MQYLQLIISQVTFLVSESCATQHIRRATVNHVAAYAVGTTIPIICREGYMLNGPSTMTCQTGGTWSPAPKCEEIGNLLYLSVYIYFYPTVKASEIEDMKLRRIDIPHLTTCVCIK